MQRKRRANQVGIAPPAGEIDVTVYYRGGGDFGQELSALAESYGVEWVGDGCMMTGDDAGECDIQWGGFPTKKAAAEFGRKAKEIILRWQGTFLRAEVQGFLEGPGEIVDLMTVQGPARETGWKPDETGFASAGEWMHDDEDTYYPERRAIYDLARERAACLVAEQYPESVQAALDAGETFFVEKRRRLERDCLPAGRSRAQRAGRKGYARGNVFRLLTSITDNILSGLIARLGPYLEEIPGIDREIMEPGEQVVAGPPVDGVTIRINRAEGTSAMLDRGHGRALAHSFDEASAALSRMAREDPPPEGGGYDKVDIEVEWPDGFVKRARFDLEYRHRYGTNLLRELRQEAEFWLGRWCPPHMTEEEYRGLLQRMPITAEQRGYYQDLLARLARGEHGNGTTAGPRAKTKKRKSRPRKKRIPKGYQSKWEWYADVLRKIGKLENYRAVEAGEDGRKAGFRYRAFIQNAQRVENLPDTLEIYDLEEDLRDAKIGPAAIEVISELETTGRSSRLEDLEQELGAELAEILAIEGVGPVTAKKILEGEVDRPEAKAAGGRIPLSKAKKIAEELKAKLKDEFQRSLKVEIAGSVRREDRSAKDVDILLGDVEAADVKDFVNDYAEQVVQAGRKRIDFVYKGIPVNFLIVNPEDAPDGDFKSTYAAALLHFTGPAGFNQRMRKAALQQGMKLNEYGLWFRATPDERATPPKDPSEKAIFKALKQPNYTPRGRTRLD